MVVQEPIDAKTLAVEEFAKYTGRTFEVCKNLLERYVPGRLQRADTFWLMFTYLVNREGRTFYKPKNVRSEAAHLLNEVEELE